MAEEQRKLAAILVADVVGYSRLVGSDEAGTLARLKALRAEVIDPAVAKHSGRLFKAVGDGLLIEFSSAVQAVTCANAIQGANAKGELQLRIGIHLGDVVVDGNDLMGDGVNIAARIEGVADAGGIAISRAVYEQVRDRLETTFVDKGEIALKNIARPVHVFAIAPSLPSPPGRGTAGGLALPDKPSIAVLPFQNMSGDPEQEYFVDGVVEEIITSLSRNKQLFVIARNSSFTYKGRAVDIKQIGHELGVRYVLEGSVRKAGNRVRIAGQLIDASSGVQIWAERFDGAIDDIFELQDQVTSNVIGGISTPLLNAEVERAKRKVDNLQAYDFLLRSWAVVRRFTPEASNEALAVAREAVALDPDFALGHAAVANLCNSRWAWKWPPVTQDGEAKEAERAVRRALTLDSNDPRVLAWCGQTLIMMLGRLQEGSALLDRAVTIDPNFALGFINRASARIAQGEPEKAIEDIERALRLSPIDPGKSYALTVLARAYNYCSRYDKALPVVAESLRMRPNFPAALIDSTVAHALAGDLESARRSLALFQKIHPGSRIAMFRQGTPHHSAAGVEKYVKGLRLAGMPE